MVRPRVEAQARIRSGDEPREPRRRLAVLYAAARAILAARRRLAGGDERARARALDPVVGRANERRVGRRCDRPPVVVELRREELPRVRLVPDRVEAHERVAGMAPRVTVRERVREVAQVARVAGRDVLPQPAVGPPRRAPDRQQHLEPALLGVPDELVDVAEAVLGGERVARMPRLPARDERPLDDRADHARALAPRAVEVRLARPLPPERLVVEEADVEPRRRRECGNGRWHARVGAQRHRRERGDHEQEDGDGTQSLTGSIPLDPTAASAALQPPARLEHARPLRKVAAQMARFPEVLNEQIGREFAASQQYVAIAVSYDDETLPQLAGHFYRQAVEERNHAMMIVQYLLDAGERVTVPGVEAPQTSFADPVAPVRLALEQERRVTDDIVSLAKLAREEGDLVGEQFLHWFL